MSRNMSQKLSCWQCGSTLENVIFPMSRREECSVCHADQHVCKMCKEFDAHQHCIEPRAEDVSDPEKANFCDYFSPSGQTFAKVSRQKEADAKAELAALFGEDSETEIIKDEESKQEESLTPAELAERKLRQMLGD